MAIGAPLRFSLSSATSAVKLFLADSTSLRRDERRLRAEDPRRELHLILAANVERRALVQLRRRQIENAPRAIRRGAAGLLDDERQRIRLVEQAQLAVRRLFIGRIGEDAAAEEVAME